MKKILLTAALTAVSFAAAEECASAISTGPFLTVGLGHGTHGYKLTDKVLNPVRSDDPFKSGSGFAVKVQGGWDHVINRFVVGGLFHAHNLSAKIKDAAVTDAAGLGTAASKSYTKSGIAYGAFVRLGYLLTQRTMVYLGLGPVWQQVKMHAVSDTTPAVTTNTKNRAAAMGVMIGMETAVYNNWSLGVSHLMTHNTTKHKTNCDTAATPNLPKKMKIKSKVNAFFVDVTYRFAVGDSASA